MSPRGPSVRAGRLALFLLSLVSLGWGFFANGWRVAGDDWFDLQNRDMESFVLGRLAWSRQEGIFASGGLTGVGTSAATPPAERGEPTLSASEIALQARVFRGEERFDGFLPYKSQIGGQGILFGLLDRILPGPPAVRIRSLHLVASLLSAAALALVVLFFRDEHGPVVAAAVLVSALLSPWLTVFGRSLWWNLWAFYLPMIVVAWGLRVAPIGSARRIRILALCVFAGYLAKCFVNGYEYATTTLVMLLVPLVHEAVREREPLRGFLRDLGVALLAAGLATASSLLVLFAQLGAVTRDWTSGPRHVVDAFARRTGGSPEDLAAAAAAGIGLGPIDVSRIYFGGRFFDLAVYLPPSGPRTAELFAVTYLEVVLLFAAASAALLFVVRRSGDDEGRRARALVAATWFSFLAPLSWFVLFREHSVIHTHMNFVAWQMPFTLFGFATCGAAFVAAARRWGKRGGDGATAS